ncbi:MAG: hypothetical protein HKN20_02640, partial [Gemmatimonadetes bacterium]|nr:hypothetical protein [Gemmatimonadota bacterium]
MTTETGIEKEAVIGPETPFEGGASEGAIDVPNGEKGRILAAGFGTTVAMWAIGYITHMPAVSVPQWLTVALLAAVLVHGGFRAARATGDGLMAGVKTGLLSSLLNLLVLGSLLGGNEPGAIVPSAAIMIPGFLAAGALLAGIGGAIAGKGAAQNPNGTGAFAGVGAMATLLLLVAGGIVTSQEAGLAVVDWPNSFGYNMFLYPLSRMSGGVFYEHAHRLLGSLVGITTVVLAFQIFRIDRRGWVKGMAALAVVLVIVQGIMGGLRVTGKPTLSTAEADMAPSIELAVAHGVTGQVFFGLMVALALVLSTRWFTNGPAVRLKTAGTERTLAIVFLVFVVLQIALGAVLRHMDSGLLSHIGMSVLVLGLAVFV